MKYYLTILLLLVVGCGKSEQAQSVAALEKLGAKILTNDDKEPFLLDLNDTKIDDAGLEHGNGLTKLEFLYLSDTEITDTGLVHLAGMEKLEQLYLYRTKDTETAVAELQNSLPNCHIFN